MVANIDLQLFAAAELKCFSAASQQLGLARRTVRKQALQLAPKLQQK